MSAEPQSVAADPTATDVSQLHAAALALVEAGRLGEAGEKLRRAVRAGLDLTLLNDLAVVLEQTGEGAHAEVLLRACLAIEPGRSDARENLELLGHGGPAAGAGADAWRSSRTLGGPDAALPERAFPGMDNAVLIAEHTMRYSLGQALTAGRHVLDLGCGTGYGSEMLTWTSRSVRGFDLWQPAANEWPEWPGGAELEYGHDLCRDPLPRADAAVMFEVIEHLDDAPAALRLAFGAAQLLVTSFPNPVHHGSHMNAYHVNDWTLERFEQELAGAASERFGRVELMHLHQVHGSPLLQAGRDPDASYWIVVAAGVAA